MLKVINADLPSLWATDRIVNLATCTTADCRRSASDMWRRLLMPTRSMSALRRRPTLICDWRWRLTWWYLPSRAPRTRRREWRRERYWRGHRRQWSWHCPWCPLLLLQHGWHRPSLRTPSCCCWQLTTHTLSHVREDTARQGLPERALRVPRHRTSYYCIDFDYLRYPRCMHDNTSNP